MHRSAAVVTFLLGALLFTNAGAPLRAQPKPLGSLVPAAPSRPTEQQ
jgi:hypothetical protein